MLWHYKICLLIVSILRVNTCYGFDIGDVSHRPETVYYNECRHKVSLGFSIVRQFTYSWNMKPKLWNRRSGCADTSPCMYLSLHLKDYSGNIYEADDIKFLETIPADKDKIIKKLTGISERCQEQVLWHNSQDICMASIGFMKCLESDATTNGWKPILQGGHLLVSHENYPVNAYWMDTLPIDKQNDKTQNIRNHNLKKKNFTTAEASEDTTLLKLQNNCTNAKKYRLRREGTSNTNINLTDIEHEYNNTSINSTFNETAFISTELTEIKKNIPTKHSIVGLNYSNTGPFNTNQQADELVLVILRVVSTNQIPVPLRRSMNKSRRGKMVIIKMSTPPSTSTASSNTSAEAAQEINEVTSLQP